MPYYSYRTLDGEVVEFRWTFSDLEKNPTGRPPRIILLKDGRRAERDLLADGVNTTPAGEYPYWSTTFGVASEDEAHRKHWKSLGVDVRYDALGRMEVRDADHRRQMMKINGWEALSGPRHSWATPSTAVLGGSSESKPEPELESVLAWE